jgi:hypothetical protein
MKADIIIARSKLKSTNIKNIRRIMQNITPMIGRSTSIRLNICTFHPSEVKIKKIESIEDATLSKLET